MARLYPALVGKASKEVVQGIDEAAHEPVVGEAKKAERPIETSQPTTDLPRKALLLGQAQQDYIEAKTLKTHQSRMYQPVVPKPTHWTLTHQQGIPTTLTAPI